MGEVPLSSDPRAQRAARSVRGRVAWVVVAAGLVGSMLVPTGSAFADTAPSVPSDPRTPETVSTDSLPVPQIGDGLSDGLNDVKGSGVVWDQVVIGDTVYVGGNFQNARPAGAGKGEKVVARSNFLAYDLKTGALLDYAPSFNGQIRSLAVSPDGKRLYAGGSFTQVNGVARYRLAAFDVPTGTLDTGFQPEINATVNDVSASDTGVYVAGALTTVGKQARPNFAAVDVRTGAVLPWAPQPKAGGNVSWTTGKSILVAPDSKKVIVSGTFWTMNGSSAPGRGMAALDATTAAILPWKVNSTLKNGTTEASSFMDLTSDGTSVYGAGFQNGAGDGLFEGTFKASWADGSLEWMTNCHGDSYSIAASQGAVYTASHAHYCGGIGAFPDGSKTATSDQYHRALAFSSQATQKLTAYTGSNSAYNSHTGQPGPSLLDWYPEFAAGAFTGMTQGPWDVTAAQGYVLYGGEFPRVNGVPQTGLARFAPKAIAPNKEAPQLSGDAMTPTVTGFGGTYVKLSWAANYDRDNARLTYQVIRNGDVANPVFETTVESRFWQRPTIRGNDGVLVPGTTYSYQIRTIDPFGNATMSSPATYTATEDAKGDLWTSYDKAILQDQPNMYFPMNELAGGRSWDWVGSNTLAALHAREDGIESAANGRANSLTNDVWAATEQAVAVDQAYSSELWFKTAAKRGGVLMAMGANRYTGDHNDRHVYMDDGGRIWAANYDGAVKGVSTKGAYNDGKWHHVVNTLGPKGLSLYVDGVLAGSRTDTTSAFPYTGEAAYWLIGAQTMNVHPNRPANTHFQGAIDNMATYARVLDPSTITAHYQAGAAIPNVVPVASFVASAKELAVSVDASGSTDSDGKVASYAWTFGDGSTGTGVTASHTFAKAGTYTVGLTVTDDRGGKSTVSKSVTVSTTPVPPVPPVPSTTIAEDAFERSVASGWSSATVGGAWKVSSGSTASVGNGSGVLTSTKGQTSAVSLPGAVSDSSDSVVSFRLDNAPTGGGQYVAVTGRQVGSDSYVGRVWIQSNGVLQLQIQRSGTIVSSVNLTGVTYKAGDVINLRFQVTGVGTTTLSAKAWTTGAEPAAWTRTIQDTTAALQAPGTVGLGLYVSSTATAPSSVSFDNYAVKKVAP
jgi:PKD repeat protein